MNIFVLSQNTEECAKYHCNKHIVKMPIEYNQILSTAARLMGFEHAGYKSTHINHPSVKWAAKNINNWRWLHRLAIDVGREYTLRYNKVHLSTTKLSALPPELVIGEYNIPDNFDICVSDDCVVDNPVESYRNYYRKHKAHIALWAEPSGVPDWFSLGGI